MKFATCPSNGRDTILQDQKSFEIDFKFHLILIVIQTLARRNGYLHKFLALKIVKMMQRQCGWKITIHFFKAVNERAKLRKAWQGTYI